MRNQKFENSKIKATTLRYLFNLLLDLFSKINYYQNASLRVCMRAHIYSRAIRKPKKKKKKLDVLVNAINSQI